LLLAIRERKRADHAGRLIGVRELQGAAIPAIDTPELVFHYTDVILVVTKTPISGIIAGDVSVKGIFERESSPNFMKGCHGCYTNLGTN